MANLKDIQRQIKSVSNTQKTTRAMKLVSTAKLRRAEELAKRSRLYAQKMNQVIAEIAGRIDCSKIGGIDNRCFTKIDNPKIVDIIFVTADKGLCGGFNIQTIKAVKKLLKQYKEQNVKVRLRGIGKKGVEFFKFNEVELFDSISNLSSKPEKDRSDKFIATSIEDYKDGKIDALHIIYNGYKNMITQELHVTKVLPVDTESFDCDKTQHSSMLEVEAEDEEHMLDSLVSKYVEYSIYYALIDSLAAEHSARMQAMDAATKMLKIWLNHLMLNLIKHVKRLLQQNLLR
jgi:F-type H+-transporting ATPase subunit gamma